MRSTRTKDASVIEYPNYIVIKKKNFDLVQSIKESKSLVEKSKVNRNDMKDEGEYEYKSDEEDQEVLADDDEADSNIALRKCMCTSNTFSKAYLFVAKQNPMVVEEFVSKDKNVNFWYSQDLFQGLVCDCHFLIPILTQPRKRILTNLLKLLFLPNERLRYVC